MNANLIAVLLRANHEPRWMASVSAYTSPMRSDKLSQTRNWAGAYGLRFLGNGAFSTAWQMLDGRVLKIGEWEDDGYHYAVWCKEHMGDPGVPNVYEVHTVPGGWYCIMEHVTIGAKGDGAYCDAVCAFVNDTGRDCSDLHFGNYGVTRDGRSVCIDPVGVGNELGAIPAPLLKPTKKQYGPHRGRWS